MACRLAARALVTALAASLTTTLLAAARPRTPCPPGRFLVEGGALVDGSAPLPDAITLAASRKRTTVAIASGCPAVRARRKGATITARWRPGACGRPERTRLRAAFDGTCARLAGTVSAGGVRTPFTARRSVCGDGIDDAAGGETCDRSFGTASPRLDAGRAVTGVIGRGGGALAVTAPGGAALTLTVPPGALARDETITLTPVTDLGGTPLDDDLIGAVELAPDGLRFARPATLEIALPAGDGLPPVVGVAWAGAGERLRLTPITAAGGSVTMHVLHFSGYGAAAPDPGETDRIQPPDGSPAEEEFEHTVASVLHATAEAQVNGRPPPDVSTPSSTPRCAPGPAPCNGASTSRAARVRNSSSWRSGTGRLGVRRSTPLGAGRRWPPRSPPSRPALLRSRATWQRGCSRAARASGRSRRRSATYHGLAPFWSCTRPSSPWAPSSAPTAAPGWPA